MAFLTLAHQREEDAQRRREMLLHVRDHDPFDARPGRRLRDLRIEAREDHDDPRTRVRELAAELPHAAERVGRNHDRSGLERPEERVDELRAAWKNQRHAVTPPDPEPLAAGGGPL